MNEHSSRSHAIFTITIECSEKGVDGNMHVRMGKLHLVDLAVSHPMLLKFFSEVHLSVNKNQTQRYGLHIILNRLLLWDI